MLHELFLKILYFQLNFTMLRTNTNFFDKTALFLFLILYSWVLYLKITHAHFLAHAIIPFFIGLFFVFSVITVSTKNRRNLLVPAALFFVLCGDILINWTPYGIYCIIPFALTHLLMTLFYLHLQPYKQKDLLVLAPILLISSFLFAFIQNDISSLILKIAAGIYWIILDIMLWRAFNVCFSSQIGSSIKWKVGGGAFLFYVTDIVVSLEIIYPCDLFRITTWLIYPLALAALSTLGRL